MKIEKRMIELGIDPVLTEAALKLVNRRESGEQAVREKDLKPEGPFSIPVIDGTRIIDRRETPVFTLPAETFRRRAAELNLPAELIRGAAASGESVLLEPPLLRETGLALLPAVAFGILNGGSASTYADEKKNRDFHPGLFEILLPEFRRMADLCRNRAKGVTPAFINPDGSPGPSFLELKLRGLLLLIQEYQSRYGQEGEPLFPLFQMTSILNDREIAAAFDGYRSSPLLKTLIESTGVDISRAATGVQPLTAALTHRDHGFPRRIFTEAWGKTDEPLPFPGGHGQNFAVLKTVYQDLHRRGKRYVYLGNVDNLGNTPDLQGIAMLALSGKQAAFDFSFRTPVDVKGGILLENTAGKLDCADIGAAVSRTWAEEQTSMGKKILFNCATGLFDLTWLTENIDRISSGLPLRVTEQDKDPGKYAQTEQITWEVMGMMDNFLVFGVDKYRRFLASKLLTENLMLSGIALDHPDYPRSSEPESDLHSLSRKLNSGLERVLTDEYGMIRKGGEWLPKEEGI